jgi:hypothetical protein
MSICCSECGCISTEQCTQQARIHIFLAVARSQAVQRRSISCGMAGVVRVPHCFVCVCVSDGKFETDRNLRNNTSEIYGTKQDVRNLVP